MATTHIVKQGQHMSGIAEEHGFGDFHILWDLPENAALKAKRDPHVLFPGDKVFIPDRKDKTEQRPTGAVHIFVTEIPPLLLRLRLLDLDGKPIANALCDVAVEPPKPNVKQKVPPKPKTEQVSTDKAGIMEKGPIARRAEKGEVIAHLPPPKKPAPKKDDPPPPPPPDITQNYDLRIGSLNPPSKLSGQQARLNNMGYYAGFSVTNLDQLLWASEEFSCEKVSKPVTKRPKIEPAPPQGEDDETKTDPDSNTGIQDPALVKKILQEHGI